MEENQKRFVYKERRNSRAKRMCLNISADGTVIASRPWWVSSRELARFVKSKTAWVLARLDQLEKIQNDPIRRTDREAYLKYKEKARKFIQDRVNYFNQFYKFKFNRIAIRNQRSLWGSCSQKRNLNFNYKLLFLPRQVADYIVVHELCHLGELNHSSKFWGLVARAIPEYKNRRRELRDLVRGNSDG